MGDILMLSRRFMKYAPLAFILSAISAPACSVDFDGFVFDDEQYAEAQADGDGDGDGDNMGGQPGDGDATGDGDGDAQPNPNQGICEDFCETSETSCPFGEAGGHDSAEQCLEACLEYKTEPLECRIFQLSLVPEVPDDTTQGICQETLPEGGELCTDSRPSPCRTFCDSQATTCSFGVEGGYESDAQCFTRCERYTEEQLKCRQTHLLFAAADDPAGSEGNNALTHCPHTFEEGGGQCPDAREAE